MSKIEVGDLVICTSAQTSAWCKECLSNHPLEIDEIYKVSYVDSEMLSVEGHWCHYTHGTWSTLRFEKIEEPSEPIIRPRGRILEI